MTDQSKDQARIAGAIIGVRAAGGKLDDARRGAHASTADSAAVPQVVFTDPEVASVGLTAREAERAGADSTGGLRHRAWAGAVQYADGYRGKARLLVDLHRGNVLGATFVGAGVAELLFSATVAITSEVPVERLWQRRAGSPDHQRSMAASPGDTARRCCPPLPGNCRMTHAAAPGAASV